jgi:hypothetical protein
MSYFYEYLQGMKGETTRRGSKGSGIKVHIRSWSNDVFVSLDNQVLGKEDKDILNIKIPRGLDININGIKYIIKEDKLQEVV